jgi:hypothetical protein
MDQHADLIQFHTRKTEGSEFDLVTAMSGYRLTDHKHKEHFKQGINIIIEGKSKVVPVHY